MNELDVAAFIIRLGIGTTMVAFGLHQIVHPEKWLEYIPKWLGFFLPTSREHFLRSHGAGNFLLGTWLILGFWQPVAVWITLLWWVSILPFALRVQWSIGLRDLSIIASLVALLLIV